MRLCLFRPRLCQPIRLPLGLCDRVSIREFEQEDTHDRGPDQVPELRPHVAAREDEPSICLRVGLRALLIVLGLEMFVFLFWRSRDIPIGLVVFLAWAIIPRSITWFRLDSHLCELDPDTLDPKYILIIRCNSSIHYKPVFSHQVARHVGQMTQGITCPGETD